MSVQEELSRLKGLRDAGVISEQEFLAKKRRLVGDRPRRSSFWSQPEAVGWFFLFLVAAVVSGGIAVYSDDWRDTGSVLGGGMVLLACGVVALAQAAEHINVNVVSGISVALFVAAVLFFTGAAGLVMAVVLTFVVIGGLIFVFETLGS
ncbi:MAG: SHOCT domain-containing protein [Paracoccaceae bacterium]